jgi:hypothetical protein
MRLVLWLLAVSVVAQAILAGLFLDRHDAWHDWHAANGMVLPLLALVLAVLVWRPGRGPSLSLLVLFPLTLASNIFVDPATMPGWLQGFIDVNPVSHLVTASRGLMAGTATAGQVGWVLAASAALTAIFAPLTSHMYRSQRYSTTRSGLVRTPHPLAALEQQKTTRRNVMSQPTPTTCSHHAGSAELFCLEGRSAEGGKGTI